MKSLVKPVDGAKVFVGLSGGVDSAVTAALLKRMGADVTGVFIKGAYPEELQCTWAEDRRDAMRVAAFLGIPFVTLDASEAYQKSVIDYLVSEYKAGRTPNPDIFCNRDVKFGVFYEYVKEKAGDYIATGHYARTLHGDTPTLLRGVDPLKDQSYFLWAVSSEALSMTLFPLGEMEKKQVRKQAELFNLPVKDKKDSQGICFLGPVSMDDFLKSYFTVEEGIAVDESGKEVGRHEGALLYTLGERVALVNAPAGPWYVHKKDLEKNQITVSKERTILEKKEEIRLSSCNWLKEVADTEVVEAQYRYHGPILLGTLNQEKGIFSPSDPLTEPIAEGQSLVIYQKDLCIGGGIIAK